MRAKLDFPSHAVPLLLLLSSCGSGAAGARAGAVSPGAPGWARSGDQKSKSGSSFVCEGAGPSEELAQKAALAACSAKICELCGVEVKATVTTRETLSKVSIERKVVETCRRVRKGEEEIRYKQSSCGPDGCTSWLQVFFAAEAEARECKAYAEGNYADPAECEHLIDAFRGTSGLSAASFRTRVSLLDRAIIACAQIDVRPTPKLTAMDEILWQGVVSPANPEWERSRDDPSRPLGERVRVFLSDRETALVREHAANIYAPIDRQPLREAKVFVDRLAIIRDAMRAYASIMALSEALNHVRYAPERPSDEKPLVEAMRDVVPFARFDKERLYGWVMHELSDARRDFPAVKDFLLKVYPPPWSWRRARDFADLFAADDKVTDDEWAAIMQGEPCVDCLGKLVGVRDHGGDSKRLRRIVEAANKVFGSERKNVTERVFDDLDGDWLLRSEPRLAAEVVASVFTWDRLKRALAKLPTLGTEPAADRTRKALAARLGKQLDRDITGLKCDQLSDKLDVLETEGETTRRFEAEMCKCLTNAKDDRIVGHVDGLYLRLVDWAATCVRKGGPS